MLRKSPAWSQSRWGRGGGVCQLGPGHPCPLCGCGLPPALWAMVPARPNVPAAGTPRSKVKYSALPSSEDGRVDPQEETPPAEGCCPPQRCRGAAGPRWMELQESPAKTPYRALACFTLQFLVGAFLATAGCLLLAGYLSPVGPRRAVAVLIVGILVLLPGLYHLLFACKAHRGCQGYSYRDLPDCGD